MTQVELSAQPDAAAVWLVKDPVAAPESHLPTVLLAGAGLVLAAAVAAALITLVRGHVERNAPELAFRRLARRLGVREDTRRALRHLARAHGDTTPTAVLLSDTALEEAVRAWAASGSGGEHRPRILELLARRGLETSLVPSPSAAPRRTRPARA